MKSSLATVRQGPTKGTLVSAKNAAAEAAKKGARGVGRKIDQKLGKSNKSTVKIKLPRIGRL